MLNALKNLWGRPFQSLPSRITFFVFVTTLGTSLIVIWTTIHSTHGFLREAVDRKLPTMLAATADRLELWFSQRRLDVETFARSSTIQESIAELGDVQEPERLRVEQYLSFVLERSDQYRSLFVLSPDGQVLAGVGESLPLTSDLRSRLAAVEQPAVRPFERLGEQELALASAPIRDAGGQLRGSLHAALVPGLLEQLLASDELSPDGEIFLVDAQGTYLTASRGRELGERHTRTVPAPGAAPRVDHYNAPSGVHVVGSAVRPMGEEWAMVVEEPYSTAFAPAVRVLYQLVSVNLGIVLLFSLIAFRIASSVVRPILALSEGARLIAEGETDVAIPETRRGDETGLLIRTFNEMIARLNRNRLELQQNRLEIEAANSRLRAQNEELERANDALERLSVTDGLTELYNHRYFQDRLGQEMAVAERSGDPLALILIDIDDFKRLNDRYGHTAGDALLRRISEIMRGSVRESDTLARYGGEEFGLLAPRTDREGAITLANKLRSDIELSEIRVADLGDEADVQITVSIGVALFRGDRTSLFEDADRALYRAKGSGKNCVAVA